MSERMNEENDEQIRNRAHEIYLRRGSTDGDPVADWLEAEREVRGSSSAPRTPDDLRGSGEPQDLDGNEQRH